MAYLPQDRRRHDRDAQRAAAARRPTTCREDFLTLLLSAEGPDGLTRGEIEDNIITFIGAGHETTARALGWTLYCLAEAPWEREPIEERDRRGAGARARSGEMARRHAADPRRLRGGAAALSAGAVDQPRADRDRTPTTTSILPQGAQVLVMPWTVHRHRKLWDEPDAFMPSRFHPGNRDKIDRYQYLPFGAGPRICIGASFAMQEAVIALAVLLSRYRFDIDAGHEALAGAEADHPAAGRPADAGDEAVSLDPPP